MLFRGKERARSSIKMKSLPVPSYLTKESFDIFHGSDDVVEQAKFFSLFDRHPIVSVNGFFNRLLVFSGCIRIDIDYHAPRLEHFLGLDVQIGRLTADHPADQRLVDHDAGIRRRQSLSLARDETQ